MSPNILIIGICRAYMIELLLETSAAKDMDRELVISQNVFYISYMYNIDMTTAMHKYSLLFKQE